MSPEKEPCLKRKTPLSSSPIMAFREPIPKFLESICNIPSHRIHGTGICTYIYHTNPAVHVGEYTYQLRLSHGNPMAGAPLSKQRDRNPWSDHGTKLWPTHRLRTSGSFPSWGFAKIPVRFWYDRTGPPYLPRRCDWKDVFFLQILWWGKLGVQPKKDGGRKGPVDGRRNPAHQLRLVSLSQLFTGVYISQVVQDFLHQQYLFFLLGGVCFLVGGWFPPLWEIWSSKWVHLPQIKVIYIYNIWNHHPVVDYKR